jgi:putative tryptophan/tyrosine transport system substrate-binding protein
MRRRDFILALGVVTAWPLSARGQQVRKTHTIGYLGPGVPVFALNTVFTDELRERGWIEGQNIAIEWRYAENRPAQFEFFAC